VILDPRRIATREKLILAGLFLSKFDTSGLAMLGFESFSEAFNVIGFALGGKPASIKNYRDEFDPLFPNPRAGWHQRSPRSYCANVLKDYESLDIQTFGALIKSFVGVDEKISTEESADGDESDSAFSRRLITGIAAENYFESVQPGLSEFSNYVVENTTRLGCGYDFRLRSKADDAFLAVEVKGLKNKTGGLSFTPKEHQVAATLTDRFFLFVVKNFCESPFHEIYRNPLASPLTFERKERIIVQVSWLTSV
jgi:hypothetical protein